MAYSMRELVRAAIRIHGSLKKSGVQVTLPNWPDFHFGLARSAYRRLEITVDRQWPAAADAARADLANKLAWLRQGLESVEKKLREVIVASVRPFAVGDVLADLEALSREFDSLHIDRKNSTLSVVTEPIELEQIWLGPFKIELHLDKPVGSSTFYDVIACDPNPAASNSEVTHPHVNGQCLCEGDGLSAIRAALEGGRLFDFFTIVDSVLKTYNAGSAYVELEHWSGRACPDCGDQMNEDHQCECEACESVICSDCLACCPRCDMDLCGECSMLCGDCDQRYCSGCSDPCRDCNEMFCQECLTNGRCKDCHEKERDEAADCPAETSAN